MNRNSEFNTGFTLEIKSTSQESAMTSSNEQGSDRKSPSYLPNVASGTGKHERSLSAKDMRFTSEHYGA